MEYRGPFGVGPESSTSSFDDPVWGWAVVFHYDQSPPHASKVPFLSPHAPSAFALGGTSAPLFHATSASDHNRQKRLRVKTVVERRAFDLEEFPLSKDVHFLQRWKGELGRISKQVGGNGLGGLEGYNTGAPPGVSDKDLGRVEALGRRLGSFAVIEGAPPGW